MNWEVRTMPSKTSFCNGTELRKCLSRWWPLWVLYGVILFIMLPGVLLNAHTMTPYASTEQIAYLSNVIISETQMLLPVTALCAGLLAAAAMFGYLYSPRSAGLAASLPIRRGCMFRTHLLAGLVMLLSAEVVVFALAVLIEATRFVLVIQPLLIWLGVLALETVVFYAIAVLCAMFTGHAVMLPCLYLLVNFVAVGFQLLIEAVLYTFVYGMSGMADLPVDWLSPLVLFMTHTHINNDFIARPISGGTDAELAALSFSGWTNILIWFVFALLLLVCAGHLYRRRRMESAGDTVAIPVLKPVLKYIVALFAGLALPVGVYSMLLNVPAYRAHVVPFLLLTILGAALGFVISEMAIRKSLRIPRTVWRGCAVTAAVCCLVVVGAKCDLTGYARRIPDAGQVASVQIFCDGYSSTLSEAENIQAVENIHRAVVSEREKITDDSSGVTSLQLTYKLTNGKVMMREYTLPGTSARLTQIEQVLNSDEARTTRNTPELPMTLEHITYANIAYEVESGDYVSVELTAEQALDLYENAIVPDCADGTMGRAWLTDSSTRQSTAYAVNINYQLAQYDPATGESDSANIDYTPLTDSTRTLAWLRAHGIEPLLEGQSVKYDNGEPVYTYDVDDDVFGQ